MADNPTHPTADDDNIEEPTSISWVSTFDLAKELLSRYPIAVVLFGNPPKRTNGDASSDLLQVLQYRGADFDVIAFLALARHVVEHRCMAGASPVASEDFL